MSAWVLYRDMGPTRSTEKVGKALGKSHHLIQRWCTAHRWVERVRQHDEELAAAAAEQAKKAALAEAERRRKQRLAVADAEHRVVIRRLCQMIGPDGQLTESLSVTEMVAMAKHADHTERLELGEVTTRNETRLEDMTDEQLTRAFLSLLGLANQPDRDAEADPWGSSASAG